MKKLFVMNKEDDTVNCVLENKEGLEYIYYSEDTMYLRELEPVLGNSVEGYLEYSLQNGVFVLRGDSDEGNA